MPKLLTLAAVLFVSGLSLTGALSPVLRRVTLHLPEGD